MLQLILEGHNIDDLRAKVAAAHASLGVPQPGYLGIGPAGHPSFFTGMGLPPSPNDATDRERIKQLSYSQGYNAGFGDACDRASMDVPTADPLEPERTPAATIALAESHERRAQELRKEVAWRLEQEHNLDQRQRPEGMKDYMPADVAEQATNQAGPYVNKPADSMDPFAEQAEANRKVAVAAGQARQEYYAERDGEQRLGASVSSPEMVARSLAKQGRTLPGE